MKSSNYVTLSGRGIIGNKRDSSQGRKMKPNGKVFRISLLVLAFIFPIIPDTECLGGMMIYPYRHKGRPLCMESFVKS